MEREKTGAIAIYHDTFIHQAVILTVICEGAAPVKYVFGK
jgi:hypothetical protein